MKFLKNIWYDLPVILQMTLVWVVLALLVSAIRWAANKLFFNDEKS